ncbi:MAG: hypothetical protein DSM106950_16150 [Stigonema ocellatum SAG 48.90 = DSM 106950]|nr:hypothetical protein [Stigonema ocellatum SAG 48.90 = DSM 106950]
MPTLTLTDSQVLQLVKQLPQQQQIEVFKFLLSQNWANWVCLSRDGEERARKVASVRSQDWDAMTEDEREKFIEQVLHEKD